MDEFLDSVIMKKVKFGLVGVGVGGEYVIKASKLIEDHLKIEAVASSHLERAKSFAEKWSIPAYYTDYKAMFREAGIDAAIICTPHYLHHPMALDAIAESLHVLVDKPMAISVEECEDMIKRAEAKNVKLGVIFQSRFNPDVNKVRDALESGKLGRPLLGIAEVLWNRTQEYYDKSPWRGRWATEGGGVLINQAIHQIDLLLYIMGPVDSLWAYGGTFTHNIEVEDLVVAGLKFRSGALGAIIGTTSIYPGLPTRLSICGDLGSAILEGDVLQLMELKSGEKYEKKREIESASWIRPEAAPPTNHAELLKDFSMAIIEDRSPKVDGYEGKRSIEVIRGIYKSFMEGCPVKIV